MPAKVTRANTYLEASRRFSRAASGLLPSSPQVALYLGGYIVECRLKWAVCGQWGLQHLHEAERRLSQLAGRDYNLTGAQGHDLDLLLRCAGDQGLLTEQGFYDAWQRCLEWSVDWRYWVPASTIREAGAYLGAFELVAQRLEEAH
jgi:hypothetical protein